MVDMRQQAAQPDSDRPRGEVMTDRERAWTGLPRGTGPCACGEGPAALVVPQRIEAQGQDETRERDRGDLRPTPRGDALFELAHLGMTHRPRTRPRRAPSA